jgi:arginyl-tRNA synthetase
VRAFSDVPSARDADPLITASRNPQFGDYQCNAAMSLAKIVGASPREVAGKIIAHLDTGGITQPITEASIAGPGFINIFLRPEALSGLLANLDTPQLGIEPPPGATQTIIVDLCGVNLAKKMHVGHLRSIIIGDSIARTLERLGNKVIRQNHVGDWGLPIAMVTDKLIRIKAAGRDIEHLDLDEIEKIYKAAQTECAADERGLAAARKWWNHPKAIAELEAQVSGALEALAGAKATLLKLQTGDPATRRVWQRIADVTMDECLTVCKRLGANVTSEHSAGESSYADELAGIVDDVVRRRIAEEDQGALIIRVEGFDEPCIIRKSEAGGGGYLYATTDLAGIRRRVRKLGASRVIYCVDARQGLHFKLVFGAAIKAGYADTRASTSGAAAHASLEHAAFGMILGTDGKPYKTRSGENVKLAALLDEAAERALEAVKAKNPELPAAEAKAVADAVGMAAIKYADLSSDRVKDYVFSFDRMLAFEGNTGPYLLYALVRIRSIFRKAAAAGVWPAAGGQITIGQREEKDLALALLRYPGAVRAVGETLEPHRLCQYLYDLSASFSGFFTNCPVLQAPDDATRSSRLKLCALTERVLDDGLALLGITTLDRM